MSELLEVRQKLNSVYCNLLATVSIFALMPYACNNIEAKADGADSPTVWIELGGQLERQTGQGDPYTPPFLVNYISSDAYKPVSPLATEKQPLFSNGAEGKLSFAPEGSDWVFSAAVRYGRANGKKSQQEAVPDRHVIYDFPLFTSGIHCCRTLPVTIDGGDYSDTAATHQDSHTIVDFEAGRDVGLGIFGHEAESVLALGVRFAQFTAKSTASLHAQPDAAFYNEFPPSLLNKYPQFYLPGRKNHVFLGTALSARSFHGIGPIASLNSSVRLLSAQQAGELTFDWGANAAVLFGRRKAHGQHHESGHYAQQKYGNSHYYSNNASFDRKKSVVVPNVGGFAGVSFRFSNAKVSVGYRGDFYFGAMDTGMDTERTGTVGFFGPFATISVGLGG
jgi:hypothetical protein